MKKMITAVAALLMSAATFAQTTTTTAARTAAPAAAATSVKTEQKQERRQADPAQMGKRETDKMNTLAPLGDKYDKVLAVNTEFAKKRQELRATATKDQTKEQADALRAKNRELQDAHKKDLETAMGKDLYGKYEAAQKAEREARRQARQDAAGKQPAAAPAK